MNGVVEWTASGGTIDTSGVFVAAAADTYEVHARRAGLDGSSTVVVSASPETPVPPPTPVSLAAIEVTPRALAIPPRGRQQFSAIGRLSNGNTATVRVNWTASGGSITTGGLYTAGTAAGTFRIIAVRQGDTEADTSAVTVTATSPTLVGVLVSPVSINVAPGAAQQFSAVGRNSDGTHSSIAVTWRATGGTITTGGLYMAGTTAGTFRVIAVRQGDTKADTASVTITAPAPTLTAVEVTPASASLAVGATRQFTALGRLSDGSTTSVPVTWSETGGTITAGGLYTAGSTAGTFRVIAVRQGDTKADTASVTVTNAPAAPTLTRVEVTPATASVVAGGTRQFAAVGRLGDGSTTGVTVTWSETGGTISGTGLYTAGNTAGTFRVIAARQGDTKADTASVTITASPTTPTPSAVVLTPATASVAAGATQQFTAQGKLSDGSTESVAVTYSATGGTVSTSGLYKAGTTAGTYRIIAVQQGGTKADTANVTITAQAPTLSAIVVTPGTASVAAGATQQFTASGKMSDGSTGAVTVTYAATGGTVSTTGLYKAGTTAGTYRVIAVQQGGTKADTAAVTITARLQHCPRWC